MTIADAEVSDPEEMALYTEVARRMRDARLQRKMTQQHLAEKIGARKSFIFELEHGSANPTLRTLYRVAKALDVKPSDFMPQELASNLDLSTVRSLLNDYESLLTMLTQRREELMRSSEVELDAARSLRQVLDKLVAESHPDADPPATKGS